jgi:GNAT superfamily N-acetyltransferase
VLLTTRALDATTWEDFAALVYDGPSAVGWAQFGSCEELTRIKHRRQYEATLDTLPDWRITCFFVEAQARRQGVSEAALAGAIDQIAALGGGLVEAYPEALEGQRRAAGFLYSSTASVFERQGFARARPLGLHHWVMRRQVEPS